MEHLEDKVAVVTGGGSGIGRGIARALAAERCHVIVADIDAAAATTVAAELADTGVRAIGVALDVTDRDAVEALAERAWDEFGHVEMIANNAGVFPGMSRTWKIDEANARWALEVNLMGAWFGCVAFTRRFIEQGTEAHILNTGSENSLGMAHTGSAFYTASKHALLGLSDVMRHELPPFIGVSVLCPGMTATNLGRSGDHRPERFGGPRTGPTAVVTGLDPDDIGRAAVAGVRRGDFYIVTHPPVREIVEERCTEILAAFDRWAPRYEGDDAIDTRKALPPQRR